MYYEMMCNSIDDSKFYSEEDISLNRQEIITIFHSMIQTNASTKYPLYHVYKETFQRFAYESLQLTRLLNHHVDMSLPEYKEEDKTLILKQKPKRIIELFNVEKI
jgi:hypothetical protein